MELAEVADTAQTEKAPAEADTAKGKNAPQAGKNGITLKQALRKYADTTGARKDEIIAELTRFVRWFGEDRTASTISPSEVGEFSDTHYERSSTPDFKHLRDVRDFLSYLRRSKLVTVSLAHHVRVARSGRPESKLEQRMNRDEIRLTKEGYDNLVKELKGLEQEQVKNAEDIRRAAADGDIRENSPLDAAREEQGRIAAKISEVENTLKLASIIDSKQKATGKVRVGSKVKVASPALQKVTEYQIVSSSESNPIKGKISAQSPFGKALLRGHIGSEIEVTAPNGTKLAYTIKSVS